MAIVIGIAHRSGERAFNVLYLLAVGMFFKEAPALRHFLWSGSLEERIRIPLRDALYRQLLHRPSFRVPCRWRRKSTNFGCF